MMFLVFFTLQIKTGYISASGIHDLTTLNMCVTCGTPHWDNFHRVWC